MITSLLYCGSARRRADGLGRFDLAVRRGAQAAGDDFGGVGTGVDREGQARTERGTGQPWPEEAFTHGFELRQTVVDQEQLHQHRRAADHVGEQPGTHVDQRLLGDAHQPQRQRRQQTEEQRQREQFEGGHKSAEVQRQSIPNDVVVEDHSSAALTPTE
jgi:hypothetical protein